MQNEKENIATEVSTKDNMQANANYNKVFINNDGINKVISTVTGQIRSARMYRGLSIQQVADDLKVSRATISKDEAGGKNISLAKLIKYSEYYQVQIII